MSTNKLRPTNAFLNTSPVLKALNSALSEQGQLLSLVCSQLPEPLGQRCISAQRNGSGLIIYAESSAWASRLRYYSSDLRSKLQKKGIHFDKINIRVIIAQHQRQHKPRGAARLSHDNARLIEATAKDIQDPALCASLQRLSRRGRG